MPKSDRVLGYRVVVEPRRLGKCAGISVSDELVCPDAEERVADYKRRCEQILDDVKRHAGDVGLAYVEAETEPVCEYCGRQWTESCTAFNGGCCDEDMEHEPQKDAT